MKQRKSARAILLNNRDQVLLIQHEDTIPVDPAHPDVLCYWATPGGGLEVGEEPRDALQRELREELALTNVTIGRNIGVRKVSLHLPGVGCFISHETYFMCRVSKRPELNHVGLSECKSKMKPGLFSWVVILWSVCGSGHLYLSSRLAELLDSSHWWM